MFLSACGGATAPEDIGSSVAPLAEGTLPLGLVGTDIEGFAITGEEPQGASGYVVASAGDVNGDGLDDTVVTIRAHAIFNNQAPIEKAYVVFGKSDSEPVLLSDILLGVGGFVVLGPGEREYFSGAAGGDVNGDGLSDVVLGAPGFAGGGTVFVAFGKATTLPVQTNDLLEDRGGFAITLIGPHALGATVATGDVNADGLSDVIAGASASIPSVKGKVFVAFGDTNPRSTIVPRLAAGRGGFVVVGGGREPGESEPDAVGRAVGSADVNADGYSDLLIGDLGFGAARGRVSVVFGKASTEPVHLTNLGSAGFTIDAEADFDFIGETVSTAGDMNGDGYDDIAIGCPGSNNFGLPSGTRAGYVVFGKDSTDPVSLSDVSQGLGGFAIRGSVPDLAGYGLSGGVDLNADAIPDLVVGAPYTFDSDGGAYVVYGKGDGATVHLEQVAGGVGGYALRGEEMESSTGLSVAVLKDVNGDDLGDLVVGAPFFKGGQDLTLGRSYVVFGTPDPGN